MAKKHKGNDHNVGNIIENLYNILSQLSEEEKDMLMDAVLDVDPQERMNAEYYRYEAPDYDTKPIAKWLYPLLHVSGYRQILEACEKAMKSGKGLTEERKREDIKNMFYVFFKEFEPADEMEMEEEEDNEDRYGNMSLIAAMQLMELLGLDDCDDVILESLRQDAFFWSYYTECGEEYLSYSLFRMCKDKIDLLLAFLKEGGLIPSIKPIIFDTLVMIYIHCPENKLKAFAAISNYLNQCYNMCKQGANPTNIDSYAYSLASAHIKESLMILKKIYRDIDVPEIETTGYKDIVETMNSDGVEYKYAHTTIKELILAIEAEDDETDEEYDGEYYDEYYDVTDDDDEMSPGLNHVCLPYDEPKKYTLRIAMNDSLEPVERTFTAPSTMYLNHLANVIMISLGHDGMPEDYYYFVDKYEQIYSSIGTSLEGYDSTEITENTVIADILEKKNSSAILAIVGDDNTEWKITITLEASDGKYRIGSNLDVKLISGNGAYPPASCETYKDYETLFSQKKLKRPNFKTAQKKINSYLASIELPF